MALAAADEVDGVIAALTDDAVEALLAAGWNSLLGRSVHRDEHLDALEGRSPLPPRRDRAGTASAGSCARDSLTEFVD
jgi:hypothetical protein